MTDVLLCVILSQNTKNIAIIARFLNATGYTLRKTNKHEI